MMIVRYADVLDTINPVVDLFFTTLGRYDIVGVEIWSMMLPE